MGKVDEAFNRCLSENHRFAECFNLAVGKSVIEPEGLSDKERTVSGRHGRKKENDCIKEYQHQVFCGIVGIEGQNKVCIPMAARNYIYEAMRYDEQLTEIRKAHRKNKDVEGAEYLAGFAATDRLIPVIIVCVYFGEEPWNAPTSLHELLDFQGSLSERQEVFRSLVNDYQLRILDVRRMDEDRISTMTTDLKHLFGMIQCSDNKTRLISYLNNNKKEVSDLDEDIYDTLEAIMNLGTLKEKIEETRNGGRVNMCKAIEDLEKELQELGEAKGRTKGRIEGRREGKLEGKLEAISTTIRILRQLGKDDTFILDSIMKEFQMEREVVLSLL